MVIFLFASTKIGIIILKNLITALSNASDEVSRTEKIEKIDFFNYFFES
jgi:hypothetical protein